MHSHDDIAGGIFLPLSLNSGTMVGGKISPFMATQLSLVNSGDGLRGYALPTIMCGNRFESVYIRIRPTLMLNFHPYFQES